MKVYETEKIRNIAVVGHGDSGKTSVLSTLLFKSGMVNRLGKVLDKNTVTDFDDEEKERAISISAALAFAEWKDCKINLIDTPGYAAFIAEAKAAMRVVDAAMVVVSGVSGVEVQTEKVWQWADEYGLPRIMVMNLMDRDRAEYERVMNDLHEKLAREIVSVQLPIGQGNSFKGVVDLINMKGYEFAADESGKCHEIELSGDLKSEAEAKRSELVEMIAEMDDKLMEKYFESGELSKDEISSGLKKGVFEKNIFPLFLTSASKNIGADMLLDAVVELLPSPEDLGEVKAFKADTREEVTVPRNSSAPFSALVFKTLSDPYAGKITLFRIYSGKLTGDGSVYNSVSDKNERIGGIFCMQGVEHVSVPEMNAGDMGATAKLKATETNHTLCAPTSKIVYEGVDFPVPAISFALEPKSRGDEEKLGSALSRVAEADPTIKVHRDPQTNELLISGSGQLHVEVIVSKLKRQYDLEVILHPPKVPYLETIRKSVESHHRHKKQTGGKGQFAEVYIKIEPLPRGGDFEFSNDIFGGSVPAQYVPAVEKGIRESKIKGILSGNPVIDFRVSLYDGSFHAVDSSEMAFKLAASKAFKKGVAEAQPVILEPIMNVEIFAPEENMGDVMGDLNSRRGRVQGMDSQGSLQVIKAQVPMAEILSYASTLKSITGGRGNYTMVFSHYDEVPFQIQEKIVSEYKGEEEEED